MSQTSPERYPPVAMPPEPLTSDGAARCVGVELEFSGLSLDEIIDRVCGAVGGTVDRVSNYEAVIEGTRVGKIRVELDALLFRKMKVRGFLNELHLDRIQKDLGAEIEEFMAGEARRFVPFELVFAPIPIARLAELEPVREALREGSAGTHASLLNAFGLHLNPELPALDVATILRYLRALIVLLDRLRELHDVDPSRLLSPFIDPFPSAYVAKVLDSEYDPSLSILIDDYLKHNPTRNRPLDMLPLFAWLDKERVIAALPEAKISARPTLHYRLPNSQLDEADWSIVREWNRWVEVEKLAADEETLGAAMQTTLCALEHPLRRLLERFWK